MDEPAFLRYAKCVFDLSTSIGTNTSSGDAATFGMLQHMGSSQGSSQHTNESHRISSAKQQKEIVPWMESVAKQQFKVRFHYFLVMKFVRNHIVHNLFCACFSRKLLDFTI